MLEYGRGRLKSEVLGCFLRRDEYFIEKNNRSVNQKKKSKAWNTQLLVPLLKTAVGREKWDREDASGEDLQTDGGGACKRAESRPAFQSVRGSVWPVASVRDRASGDAHRHQQVWRKKAAFADLTHFTGWLQRELYSWIWFLLEIRTPGSRFIFIFPPHRNSWMDLWRNPGTCLHENGLCL